MQSVTVDSVLTGRVCLTIDYVKGHEIPPHCFVRLSCAGYEHTQMIIGTSGCIRDVLPHESCNLTATDGDDDAVHNINTAAPVTITGISVPSYTVAPSTTSTTPTTTPIG